jgi:hypothetical protein
MLDRINHADTFWFWMLYFATLVFIWKFKQNTEYATPKCRCHEDPDQRRQQAFWYKVLWSLGAAVFWYLVAHQRVD